MTRRGRGGIASIGAATMPVTARRWPLPFVVQYWMRHACVPGGVSVIGWAEIR